MIILVWKAAETALLLYALGTLLEITPYQPMVGVPTVDNF